MSLEENKAVVRRFYQAFAADDHDAMNALLAPDLVAYSHGEGEPQNREVHLQGISGWNAAFESEFTIEEQIAEGDSVATRMTSRFTHNRGGFMGAAPTGKESVNDSMSIERVKDGRIVERRAIADWSGIMQQLGLVPLPEAEH
ncbi:MAG: ester cyclase [Candidatus Promineifilaceae bacterium]|nr:ester cyclase [Candidatus Promineifilaceae bacterium]